MPKGSFSNNRKATTKAKDHATHDEIRDLAIQKPVVYKKYMFDHPKKLTYLQKFSSSGLSLNIFDFVRRAQITFQMLPIVDGTVHFPFYMALDVYYKVAK